MNVSLYVRASTCDERSQDVSSVGISRSILRVDISINTNLQVQEAQRATTINGRGKKENDSAREKGETESFSTLGDVYAAEG